jgi:chemotaxis protein CheC
MTKLGEQVREVDVDRVRELTSIGAGHAATAFARLVGRPCQMRVPTVRLLRAEFAATPFVAAVRDQLVEQLIGLPAEKAPQETAQSALREFGNILASHVVSPMADALGVAILPSIPVLAMEDGLEALGSLIGLRQAGQPALRIETEISDRRRDFRGLLVFVPDSATMVSSGRPSGRS